MDLILDKGARQAGEFAEHTPRTSFQTRSTSEKSDIWPNERTEEERLLLQVEMLLKLRFEVKNQGESKAMSKEDEYSVRQMESSRVKQGEKYEMSCLWKKGCPSLTSNLKYALSRLDGLLRSKKLTPSLREQYSLIFQEWSVKGYIKQLDLSLLREKHCWFLPHFPVLRQD